MAAKWQRMAKNSCWICDQWKYTVIIFSRKDFKEHYTPITDDEKIAEIEEMYDLSAKPITINDRVYPLILGSITRHCVIAMSDVAAFNRILDEKRNANNLPKTPTPNRSSGLSSSMSRQPTKPADDPDWLLAFKENLPYPERDIVICCLPRTRQNEMVEKGEKLKPLQVRQRREDAVNDVFLYAGFVQPGKHQILIKDQEKGSYFAREVVIDIRRRDVDCRK